MSQFVYSVPKGFWDMVFTLCSWWGETVLQRCLFYISWLFSLFVSLSISLFRYGIISRLFSPRSTAAPPTWWWLSGFLCLSGESMLKRGFLRFSHSKWKCALLVTQPAIYVLQPKQPGRCWKQRLGVDLSASSQIPVSDLNADESLMCSQRSPN